MGPQHRSRRATLIALLLTIAAIAAAAAAGSTAASGATTAAPPTPHLGLSWTVIRHKCWTVTRKIRVRHGKKVRVEKKHVRVCGDRPVRARGRALHLGWRQHGEVFGHLTLAGQPIVNAPVTLTWTITNRQSGTTPLVTDAHGRFSAPIYGPADLITISYSPSAGVVISHSKRIEAAAFLSLKVGHLTAGKDGRFSGILFGGYLIQDLYIQLSYYAGASGWQPFSHLAIVNQTNGHWATNVPIPRAAAGYTYRIRASVVPSPDWPWAHTDSNIVTRRVS